MADYKIGVEVYPMIVPKPTGGFGVISDRRSVAFLTEGQMREALARFDRLKDEYEASRAPKEKPNGSL